MGFLHGQKNVSPQRGMPVDDRGSSSTIVSVTGETIQLYYSNAGVYTIDAGQAAGVAVTAKLAYSNIKNADAGMEGSWRDTSLSFTSGALTTEIEVDLSKMESMDDQTFAKRLEAITDGMSNGEYFVDYAAGIIYGKKTTTAVTLTSGAYKVQTASAAASVASAVTATGPEAENAAVSGNPLLMGGRYDSSARTLDSGDVGAIALNASGHVITSPAAGSPPSGINTSAYAASLVIKASAGTAFEIRGFNSGSAQWIQIHDASSLPADTAVPEDIVYVGANQNFSITYPEGKSFATGIVASNSSTGPTKTIGSADCWFSADFS